MVNDGISITTILAVTDVYKMMNKLKSVLGNGRPYGLVFFSLSFLMGYYALNVSALKSLWTSAVIGTAALLLNGAIYSRFSKRESLLKSILIYFDSSEQLVIEAPANHLIQEHLISGKLALTDERLIFKAYMACDDIPQNHSWLLSELKPINFSGSIWNSGGEFLLKTIDEASLMFEVNKLNPWRNALITHLPSPKGSS